MNRKARSKQILQFLSKNPLSTVREISDNASKTRINYNVCVKALAELVQNHKIDRLFGHYYITPTTKGKISLLLKITNQDKIHKPRFGRLSYENRSQRGGFREIVELYILLIRLQFKINKTKRAKKLRNIKNENQIKKDLKAYLKSFIIKKYSSDEDFQIHLIKHIDDRYFKDIRHFNNLIFRHRTLKKQVKMISTFFKTNSVTEVSHLFGYKSNKIPRKMIKGWFYANGNLPFGEIYAGIKNKEITNSEASDLFFQWQAHIGLRRTATKEGKELVGEELRQYRKNFMKNYKKQFKIDIRKVVDIKAYGIS